MSQDVLHVLVVEEEPRVAEAMRDVLERRGHRITVVACVDEAPRAEQLDVVVCDLPRNALAGLESCRRMIARQAAPRLILVLSAPTFDLCRSALHIGVTDILQKPIRLTDLVASVEACAEGEATGVCGQRMQGSRGGSFARSYDSGPKASESAARDILGHCLRSRIGPATRARIGTAVAEMVDNACRHGYRGGPGKVEIEARFDANTLRVSVRDQGAGFDPAANHPAAPLSLEMSGIARARALAEELTIASGIGCGTSVEIAFSCSRVDFDEGRKVDLSDLDFLPPLLAKGIVERLNQAGGDQVFHLSPATAVTIGRLLAGAEPRQSRPGSARN